MAFTHGYAIRYLLADIFDLNKKTAYRIPMDNTSITIIEYKDGKPKLIKQNDTKHINSKE